MILFQLNTWRGIALRFFLLERHRLFLWCPVAFACGILFYTSTHLPEISLPFIVVWYSFGVIFLGWFLLILRQNFLGWCSLWLVLMITGYLHASFMATTLQSPVLHQPTGKVQLHGRIVSISTHPLTSTLVLDQLVIQHLAPDETPHRIRVNVKHKYQISALRPGDIIEAQGLLFPLAGPNYPGSFDFGRYFYVQGIGGSGAITSPITILAHHQESWISRQKFELRTEMVSRFRTFMPPDEASLASALVVGETGLIQEELYNHVRAAGLAHVLSISGLHLTMVASVIFLIARLILVFLCSNTTDTKPLAAIIAWITTLGYLVIADMPLPALRAFIVLSVATIALLLHRHKQGLRLLSYAALIILFIQPFAILFPAFQLSFGSVMALIALSEILTERKVGKSSFPYFNVPLWITILQKCRDVITLSTLTSLVAGLATLPFVLYHFNRVALYSILGNMLALPIESLLLMPAVVLELLTYPLGIDRPVLWMLEQSLSYFIAITHFVSSLAHAEFLSPPMSTGTLLWMSFGLCWICLWSSRIRLLGFFCFFLPVITPWLSPRPDLIIDPELQMIAIRLDHGEYKPIPEEKSAFILSRWIDDLGLAKPSPVSMDTALQHPIVCDLAGCYDDTRTKLILLHHPLAYLTDCPRDTFVLFPFSTQKNRICHNEGFVQFAFETLAAQGTTTLSFDKNDRVTMTHVASLQGRKLY